MARPNELSNQFLDTKIQNDVKKAYGSMSRFAAIAGIDYHVVKRVLQNQPCRTEEIDEVMQAWGQYDPLIIKAKIDAGVDNWEDVCATTLNILAGIGAK